MTYGPLTLPASLRVDPRRVYLGIVSSPRSKGDTVRVAESLPTLRRKPESKNPCPVKRPLTLVLSRLKAGIVYGPFPQL